MDNTLTIEALRTELGLNQEQFAKLIGLSNKGSVSVIERGAPCSLPVALALEKISNGRINAAVLNADVAAARSSVFDTKSDPGSWADVIAHSPNLRVDDHSGGLAEHVIICDVCDKRVDGQTPLACNFVDCPHAQRVTLLARAA